MKIKYEDIADNEGLLEAFWTSGIKNLELCLTIDKLSDHVQDLMSDNEPVSVQSILNNARKLLTSSKYQLKTLWPSLFSKEYLGHINDPYQLLRWLKIIKERVLELNKSKITTEELTELYNNQSAIVDDMLKRLSDVENEEEATNKILFDFMRNQWVHDHRSNKPWYADSIAEYNILNDVSQNTRRKDTLNVDYDLRCTLNRSHYDYVMFNDDPNATEETTWELWTYEDLMSQLFVWKKLLIGLKKYCLDQPSKKNEAPKQAENVEDEPQMRIR